MNYLQWFSIVLGFLVVALGGISIWLWFERMKRNRSTVRISNIFSEPKLAKNLEIPSKVYLTCGDANSPIAELESFTLRKGEKLAALSETNGLPLFLSPLLQRLPELFNKGSEALGLVYRVKFSPEITRGLINGTSKLLQTASGTLKATAVSANGSALIQEGANVIGTATNPATIALIVWQVAAIVTAQKYLADIDHKLKALESQLSEIASLLQDQMFGKLKAYVTQLEVKFSAIKRGALSESDYISFGCFFDNVEHDCVSMLETSKDQILQIRKRALSAANNKDKAALLNECESMDTYSRLWSAAAYTRLVATQVKCLLPSDQCSVSAELADMAAKSADFSSARHKFLREWRQKIEKNGKRERLAIFLSKHHPQVAKSLLRCNKLAKDREFHLSEVHSATARMLAQRAQRLSQPLEIQICTKADGTFESAQLITPSDSSGIEPAP
jgi:hypothetical protein